MIEHLEVYIGAQKTIANYMLGLGILMVLLAVLFHFAGENAFFNGLKTGFLVLGLFSAISGYAYRNTEEKLLHEQSKLYQENPSQFQQMEKARMEKVVKNFPMIQKVFVAIIIALLIIFLIIKSNFTHGLILSAVFLITANMLIEKISKASIDTYYEQLIKA